jgi:DNA-binding CsgD family transcriptional regulator
MRLSVNDWEAIQRAILELYRCRGLASFHQALPRVLTEIVPAQEVLFVAGRADRGSRHMRKVEAWASSPRLVPDLVERMGQAGLGDPFAGFPLGSNDPWVLRRLDYLSVRALADARRDEIQRVIGIARRLGVTLFEKREMVSVNLFRSESEGFFTPRDRDVLEQLAPHVDVAWRNAGWISGRLATRSTSLESCGLTAREIQVANLLALGKTNMEISVLLAVRSRTVEKHVGSILAKLGVENRTAAALLITRLAAD